MCALRLYLIQSINRPLIGRNRLDADEANTEFQIERLRLNANPLCSWYLAYELRKLRFRKLQTLVMRAHAGR